MAALLWPTTLPALSAMRAVHLVLLVVCACLPLCRSAIALPYTVIGPTPASVGGMYALRSSYNRSYVAWNESYPTLHIGLSLSLLGTVLEEGWVDFLSMLVDVTNLRGGVKLNGVSHYVALTYSVDDGSPHLTELIYSDMFGSGNFSAFIAPQTDTLLQALLPLLPDSNATIISTYNPDPADFASGYRNLFGLLPPETLLFTVSLTDINKRAQEYVASGGVGSRHGIETVCMFTVNESLPQVRAEGVRDWIDAENARRNGSEPVQLLIDSIWRRTALDYNNYTEALVACPPGVDLMVLSTSDTDGLDAVLALEASQLRPKAVLGLVPDRTIVTSDPAQMATAAGWVLPVQIELGPATIYERGGIFTDIYDVAYANAVWRAGAGLTHAAQNSYAYTYLTSFTVITAALSNTKSLHPDDMRAAILSLNGETTALSGLEFDNTTGFNTQLVPLVAQATPSGQYTTTGNSSHILYPYDWPWRLPADGDLLVVDYSVNAVLIAVVISVLGGWVALIITEQSIHMKRQGSRYWRVWLFMVALSLGGVAVWCTQVMTSTGLHTRLPDSSDELPMSYSFDIAIIALLASVGLTYAGLLVLMSDVHGGGHRSSTSAGVTAGSEARAARSAETELLTRKADEKRAASLSTRLHLQHLYRSLSWRVLLGGCLVSAALYECRGTTMNIWVQPAEWSVVWYVWATVWLFDAPLCVLSCLIVFHALRQRWLGAFLFAITVMGDWFIVQRGIVFHYQQTGDALPAVLLTANVGYTALSLVAGIIAAFICFIFVGLQFSRMQLSRNGLSLLVTSLQVNTARLQDRLKQGEEGNALLKRQLHLITQQVAHISLNTPIPTHYAYCMAQATTNEAYQQMYYYLQAVGARPPLPPSAASAVVASKTKALPSASSESSPALGPRTLHSGSTTAGEAALNSRPPLRLPSITMTPTRSASVAPLPPLNTLRLRGSTTADDTDRTLQDGAEVSRSAVASDPSPSTTTGSIVAPAASLQGQTARKRRTSISGVGSTNDGGSRTRRPTRNNRTYEEQLAALLDQNSPYDSADTPPALLSPGGSNKASVSLTAHSAAHGGLATLLLHPTCIAVIKGELQAIHSVENLVFYLHAQRYRQLQSAKLRKTIATAMYETFIREGAQQQININARQRDGIGFCVTKRGDDSCSGSLFDEAQREVLQLMETNLLGSSAEKQCAWLMAQLPLTGLTGLPAEDEPMD